MNFLNDGGFVLTSVAKVHEGNTDTLTSLVNGENNGHTSPKLRKDGFLSMTCSCLLAYLG